MNDETVVRETDDRPATRRCGYLRSRRLSALSVGLLLALSAMGEARAAERAPAQPALDPRLPEDFAYQVPEGYGVYRSAAGPDGSAVALYGPDPGWCGIGAAREMRENQKIGGFDAQGRLRWQTKVASLYEIYGMFVQRDWRVLVWGAFQDEKAGERRWAWLFRIGPLGVDDSFHTVWESDLVRLTSVRLAADGSIEIEGPFTSVRGQPRQGRARLRSDGSLDD